MNQTLSPGQIDTLQEIVNIGVGQAAAMLNEMLDNHVQLSIPEVMVFSYSQLLKELNDFNGDMLPAVKLRFNGSFSGKASLVFPPDSVSKLVAILTNSDLIGDDLDDDLDELRIGALTEVGNIVINAVMGSISNMLSIHLDYSLPVFTESNAHQLLGIDLDNESTPIVIARTQFDIQALEVRGLIYLIFEASAYQALVNQLDRLSE